MTRPGYKQLSVCEELTLEDLISKLGFGLANMPAFIINSLCYASNAFYLMEVEFIAPEHNFFCNDAGRLNKLSNASWTDSECFSIKSKDEGLVACNSFAYDSSLFSSTITMEFDLICEKDYMRSLLQMMFSIGNSFGCFLAATGASKYGRQKAIWASSLLLLILTISFPFIKVLEVIMVFRFLSGIAVTVILLTSFTIGMEFCPLRWRSIYGIGVGVPFALMVMAMSLMAYYLQEWRYFHLAGSLPFLLFLPFANPWTLKESPRWFIQKGRLVEAVEVLRKSAKLNRTAENLPDDLLMEVERIHASSIQENMLLDNKEQNSCTSCLGSLRSLVSSKEMVFLNFVIIFNGVLIGTVYISAPLTTSENSTPLLFMVAMGIAELPALLFTGPITAKFGRKPVIAFCCGVVIVTKVAQITLNNYNYDDTYTTVMSSIAFMSSASFLAVYVLHTSELYPTSLRSTGSALAFLSMCAGYNIPPILDILLADFVRGRLCKEMIYGLSAAAIAVTTSFLPETNGAPLLQTVQQCIEMMRGKTKRKILSFDVGEKNGCVEEDMEQLICTK